MTSVIQSILEKRIVDHSIIHRLLMEYFSIANKVLLYCFPVKYNSTDVQSTSRYDDWHKGWSQTWNSLCKIGSAKERKKIIKGMKGHIDKIAYHQHGCMVLVCIISVVDGTKLITKAIIRELQQILKELVLEKDHSEVSYQTETSKVEEPGDDEPKEDMGVTADEANKDGDKQKIN
ncbi:pumilio-like protein 24-like [Senna tora]|uniref:Pumilio-like protein 24-like n=1 Tax=Senna tora TaxID=362788 RepID=A0A834XC79_9FABA|nr:pumilio-like protein 24-like [Senna tora]